MEGTEKIPSSSSRIISALSIHLALVSRKFLQFSCFPSDVATSALLLYNEVDYYISDKKAKDS